MKSPLVRSMPGVCIETDWVALNRRQFLAMAGGIAGSAILAACGGSTATDTPKPATPTTAAPIASAPTTAAATTGGATTAGTTTTSGSVSAGAGGQTLVIEATEYAFKTLGSIPAGVTTVQLKNLGKEHHEAQFVRLNEGVTPEQFLAALQAAGEGEPPAIFTYEGGPAEIVAGKTAEVILNFQPGQYMLLCFVDAPDGQSHVAKGMVLPVKVNAATGPVAALPAGKGTIVLGAANGFDLPATLPAGRSQYRVTNQGTGPRAFFVGGIPADKTIEDVNAELAKPDSGPPPWFQQAGGMGGLKANGSGVVTLDLTPGKYVAVDVAFGPDKPFGKIFMVG